MPRKGRNDPFRNGQWKKSYGESKKIIEAVIKLKTPSLGGGGVLK